MVAGPAILLAKTLLRKLRQFALTAPRIQAVVNEKPRQLRNDPANQFAGLAPAEHYLLDSA